jgi:hypothetical protein
VVAKHSGSFLIAIVENGTPSIVKWFKYQENPNSYQNKLYAVTSQEKHKLNEFTFFLLITAPNNSFNLTLYTDDYTYWAQYGIQNGIVQPLSFRYTGAFIIFYCLLVSSIGTPLIRWLWKRYISSVS